MLKKSKSKPLARNWKPVLRGNIYCSPACGGGCTRAAYLAAHAAAKAEAAKLGPKWTYRVHENLGWHWNVISPCRRIRITGNLARYQAIGEPPASQFWTAFFDVPDKHGACAGRWTASGKTSFAAAKNVIACVRKDFESLRCILLDLPL